MRLLFFKFTVEYRKGSCNGNSDALSRRIKALSEQIEDSEAVNIPIFHIEDAKCMIDDVSFSQVRDETDAEMQVISKFIQSDAAKDELLFLIKTNLLS